ncbi:MAG: hypothetical protein ABW252_20475 [Polyangiales bacterium]
MLRGESAQIRNATCPRGVLGSSDAASKVRGVGSTLLALLTFLFVASAQVAAVRADLTDLTPDASPSMACVDAQSAAAWSGLQADSAAYRRDVAPAPELSLDASESERSEEYARAEDAAAEQPQVRATRALCARSAVRVASAPWAARHAAPTALPRGPPTAHR